MRYFSQLSFYSFVFFNFLLFFCQSSSLSSFSTISSDHFHSDYYNIKITTYHDIGLTPNDNPICRDNAQTNTLINGDCHTIQTFQGTSYLRISCQENSINSSYVFSIYQDNLCQTMLSTWQRNTTTQTTSCHSINSFVQMKISCSCANSSVLPSPPPDFPPDSPPDSSNNSDNSSTSSKHMIPSMFLLSFVCFFLFGYLLIRCLSGFCVFKPREVSYAIEGQALPYYQPQVFVVHGQQMLYINGQVPFYSLPLGSPIPTIHVTPNGYLPTSTQEIPPNIGVNAGVNAEVRVDSHDSMVPISSDSFQVTTNNITNNNTTNNTTTNNTI